MQTTRPGKSRKSGSDWQRIHNHWALNLTLTLKPNATTEQPNSQTVTHDAELTLWQVDPHLDNLYLQSMFCVFLTSRCKELMYSMLSYDVSALICNADESLRANKNDDHHDDDDDDDIVTELYQQILSSAERWTATPTRSYKRVSNRPPLSQNEFRLRKNDRRKASERDAAKWLATTPFSDRFHNMKITDSPSTPPTNIEHRTRTSSSGRTNTINTVRVTPGWLLTSAARLPPPNDLAYSRCSLMRAPLPTTCRSR